MCLPVVDDYSAATQMEVLLASEKLGVYEVGSNSVSMFGTLTTRLPPGFQNLDMSN